MKTTIREFARNDKKFIEACNKAKVENTRRQASKFLNKKGLAYKVMKGLVAPKKGRTW